MTAAPGQIFPGGVALIPIVGVTDWETANTILFDMALTGEAQDALEVSTHEIVS
jgi:hypothetical protein